MRTLSDSVACAARAYELREQFNLSLLESLRHLLDVAEDVIDVSCRRHLEQKLGSLNLHEQYSGFLSAYNAQLIKAVEEQDIPYIEKLFYFLENEDFLIKEKFINFDRFLPHQQEIFKTIASFELPRDISFSELSLKKFTNRKDVISEALQTLSNAMPTWYEEIQVLVSEIVILDAINLNAGSSFDLFGLIYINYNYKPDKLIDSLDFIIHESAHLYIYLLSYQDSLILNAPDERYESPLRKDKRPLIGNYHACFVLARVLCVLKYLHHHNALPSEESFYLDELLEHYKIRFFAGYELLNKHGRFTDLGRKLLESSKNLVKS